MIIKREIGEKGQVVIPKDIRELLRLRKGEKVVFEVRKNEVVIKPEQDPEEFLKEFLNIPGKEKNSSIKEIKRTIMKQYEDEIS